MPFRVHSTKRALQRRSLKADAVLVTESWLGREDGVSHAAAEEAMALSLAAAKAARDAASYAEAMVPEFPSEFDLLRLERARLSDMEHSFRADYDAEAALLEAEQSYVLQLESLLGGVSSLVREAVGTSSTPEDAGTNPSPSSISAIISGFSYDISF